MNELTNTKTKVLLLLLLVAAGMGRAQELDGTRQWNVLFTKESTDIRFTVVFSFSDDDYVLYEGVQYKIMAAEEDVDIVSRRVAEQRGKRQRTFDKVRDNV